MSFLDILHETKSSPHDSAHLHVAGESEYIDDIRPEHNELYVGLLYSPYARARIKEINLSEIIRLKDIVAVFTAQSLFYNKRVCPDFRVY